MQSKNIKMKIIEINNNFKQIIMTDTLSLLYNIYEYDINDTSFVINLSIHFLTSYKFIDI